ncbi:hypothetical protein LOK49_LG05G03764 [Camellia lanceoleosa]|uniref:Uncharacterized protein n=1 Tax=Camellia lanceoleosa TaxID=1840588 RepID=A0ACC0HM18_9ERIC|nr:hypothetical protein LOK49_LG05G03764 [Camellia lanceoleosa]
MKWGVALCQGEEGGAEESMGLNKGKGKFIKELMNQELWVPKKPKETPRCWKATFSPD